jgi:hypothetical protein
MAEDAVTSEPFSGSLFPGIREENGEFEADNGRILANTPHRGNFTQYVSAVCALTVQYQE